MLKLLNLFVKPDNKDIINNKLNIILKNKCYK